MRLLVNSTGVSISFSGRCESPYEPCACRATTSKLRLRNRRNRGPMWDSCA